MAMENGYSLSDMAAACGENGCNSWVLILLFAMIFGNSGFGWGNNNAAAALGYENLATSAEVQRGLDAQNSMANEREILAAVNGNSLQGMQNSNQNAQYITGMLNDKYGELQRDIAGVAVGQANILANQNACCAATSAGLAQNRYDSSQQFSQLRYEQMQQMAQLQQAIQAEGAATRGLIQENKIEALQQKLNGVEQALNTQMLQNAIQQATAGVVRYPDSFAYNAGMNPFCNCGNGCCNI